MTAPADVGAAHFMEAANRLPTLFELEDQAYALLALLEETDFDFLQESEVTAQLALVDRMLMDKTESYVSVIRSLEKMAEARKSEADRLKARSVTAQHHADWLRDRLLAHMKLTNRPRIETSRFTLSVRQNNPSVNVLNAAAIPSEFNRTKVVIEPDKVAILAHTKATGELVAGTEIIRTERLDVR